MTYQISPIESKARTLLADYVGPLALASSKGGSYQDWQGADFVRMVFTPMHGCALPADRIEFIGRALTNRYDNTDLDLQSALTKMVKAKILNSRMIRGVRHYEINFAG